MFTIQDIIRESFAFRSISIKKLDGYDNANYRVSTEQGNFVFKTYPYQQETFSMVEAENEVLLYLQDTQYDKVPKPIAFTNGTYVCIRSIENRKSICRMLTFLEGDFLGSIEHTKEVMASLGRFLASMNASLQKFINYTIRARQWEWDLQYLQLNKKYINDIPSIRDRNTVRYFFKQYEEQVVPILPKLRKSIIHNDANEWNVLITNKEVSGIIDFGDIAYSPLINELAIAITYAVYDKENPIDWALPVLKSYHSVLQIQEEELRVLYYLIAARLCISVCNSAHSRKENPGNEYISVSEKPAWQMLYRWLEINPIKAESDFRSALDFPILKSESVDRKLGHRYQFFSPLLSVSYKNPIYMDRAAFQYMYDGYGNTFLDAYNNIPHVGHSHPRVVEAGQRQMAKLTTNTRYLYDLLPAYAEKLLSYFPKKLNKVFFVNSGSAASDLAIRMARIHTKTEMLMVMEHGYHGNTQTSIDISDYKFNNPKGQGQKGFILKTSIPDTFRGAYKINDGSAGSLYAKDAIVQIENTRQQIAAFISEPIVGCGGQVPLAKGYLKEVYPAIRGQGGVCISDEVQTGFGRLGDYFWGYEAQEVIPDMVILGKPMGNGYPIGAVVCTDEIATSFSKGVEFFSSFGGNPVSCAIGLSVLEVIEEEQLQQNAKTTGGYYKKLFLGLQQKHPCIGDVRGSGLFLGIEIVEGNSTKPDTILAHHIKNELRNRHILISTDGPYDSVIKTKPPLCFTKENAEEVVESIKEILNRYYN